MKRSDFHIILGMVLISPHSNTWVCLALGIAHALAAWCAKMNND